MKTTLTDPVIVSAAIEAQQRSELERLADEGAQTLSQQIRLVVREYLERQTDTEGGAA